MLSTAVLRGVVLLRAWLSVRRLDPTDTRSILREGALWPAFAVVLEFGFGHCAMGHPEERLVANRSILHGGVWSTVLLTELGGPILVLGRDTGDGQSRGYPVPCSARSALPPTPPGASMRATPNAPGPR